MIWRFELLGGFCVDGATGRISRFRTQKAASLLAYLAHFPRQHSRDELLDRFWPDSPVDAARLSLRTALSSLRASVGDGLIVTHGHRSVGLDPERIRVDTAQLEAALHAGRDDDALRLARGPLLPGFWDDWVMEERARLDALLEFVRARIATRPQPQTVSLPQLADGFFGRETELARIGDALRFPGVACVTGTGGIGKTRLAIECARRSAARFPGGIWFVSLRELSTADRFASQLARAVGAPRSTGVPEDALVEHLAGAGDILLVLDNLEQIAAAVAPRIQRLCKRLPDARFLVTSQRRLGIPSERLFAVEPLASAASAALFVERARRVVPEFAPGERALSDLVSLLDGIPLAIELAAARVATFSVSEMTRKLSERFALLATTRAEKGRENRSLYATLDWSYQLLTAPQRRVFRALCVFSGGWTGAWAEAVLGDPETLEYVAQLRDRSLVRGDELAGTLRFSYLESVREFAREQIDDGEWERLSASHRRVVTDWLSGLQSSILGDGGERFLDEIERDHDNVRAAIERAPPRERLNLCGLMANVWTLRGHLSEGAQRLESALTACAEPSPERLRALLRGVTLRQNQGDLRAAEAWARDAFGLSKSLGSGRERVEAARKLGDILTERQLFSEATDVLEDALTLARALGELNVLTECLAALGWLAYRNARLSDARTWLRKALDHSRGLNRVQLTGVLLMRLGAVLADLDDLDGALAAHDENRALQRKANDRNLLSLVELNVGIVRYAQSRSGDALESFRACLSLALAIDALATARGAFWYLFKIAADLGEFERAGVLLGAFLAASDRTGIPPAPDMETERASFAARVRLGPDASLVDGWLDRGRTLSLADAVAFASE